MYKQPLLQPRFEAGRIWGQAVGPEDPLVARRTDALSLRAVFGVDRARNLMTSARTVERNRREACWWYALIWTSMYDKYLGSMRVTHTWIILDIVKPASGPNTSYRYTPNLHPSPYPTPYIARTIGRKCREACRWYVRTTNTSTDQIPLFT